MIKISIIVPVYNVEKYIGRCLDSLLVQTFADFEVICIDDGSPDGSGKICEEYVKRDSRIKVHHIENGGVSNARNYALSEAAGEWYAFVDADDWVEPDYLETLYEKATENDCDIAACSFQRNNIFTMGYNKENIRTVMIDGAGNCIRNFICSVDSMQGMVWNKLYRADLFKDISFDADVKVNEDCLYTYEVMKRCRKACFVTAQLYHWFFREDSACHSKIVACDFTAANVFLHLYEETVSMEDEAVRRTLQKNYMGSVLKVFLHADYKKKDAEVKEARNRCRQWRKAVWNVLDSRTKLKYVLAFHIKWLLRF